MITGLIKRVDFETKLRNISNRSASNQKKTIKSEKDNKRSSNFLPETND